jgi:hypothetical protein
MLPGIQTDIRLNANQAVAASVALVDLGLTTNKFTFVLAPNAVVLISAALPFTVGATGGFRFALTTSQTLPDFMAAWEAIDGVTASPGAQVASIITAPADFANAWAVAGNHLVNLEASLKGHATLSSTITLQFACNTTANGITVLKGAKMIVIQTQ